MGVTVGVAGVDRRQVDRGGEASSRPTVDAARRARPRRRGTGPAPWRRRGGGWRSPPGSGWRRGPSRPRASGRAEAAVGADVGGHVHHREPSAADTGRPGHHRPRGGWPPQGHPHRGARPGTLARWPTTSSGRSSANAARRSSPAAGRACRPGGRRRTPGLRRAELATLAGVSVDYLTRLEQGRDRHPSAQVLAALADTLQLSDEERVLLMRLGHHRRLRRDVPEPPATPTARCALGPTPGHPPGADRGGPTGAARSGWRRGSTARERAGDLGCT